MTEATQLATIKERKPATPSLKKLIDQETEFRKLLTGYIDAHMKEDTDYGRIHVTKACQFKTTCRIAGHFSSKPSLFKPGAEKIGSLLKFRAEVIKDDDTWEMTGRKPGVFCYRCNLYNKKTGELEGMGLGACTLEEKTSYNTAIKIAKKRAFVDAVLSTGSLSDFFTQDLEDGTGNQHSVSRDSHSDFTKDNTKDDEIYVVTENQVKYIKDLLAQKGYSQEQLEKKYEVTALEQLTSEQASHAINGLLGLPKIAKTTEPEERAYTQDLTCAKCGQPAIEKKGETKGGKQYHGIFCSTEDRSHTRWLWN